MKCACRKNPERTAFEVFPKSIIDNDEEIVVGIWLPRDQIRIVDYILMMWIMAIRVMEFSNKGYKIRKVFA